LGKHSSKLQIFKAVVVDLEQLCKVKPATPLWSARTLKRFGDITDVHWIKSITASALGTATVHPKEL